MLFSYLYKMEKELIQYFKTLPNTGKEELINSLISHLTNDAEPSSVRDLKNDQINHSGLSCPHCSGTKIIGFGSYKGVKRYRCKTCHKTFNALTGSAFHKIHKKDIMHQYLFFMLQGYPLRKISEEMDICLKTAFDWRHKILRALMEKPTKKLNGIIESDETFFLYSEKGNKKVKGRKPRKRGGAAGKRGINKDHITVLSAFERESGNTYNTVVCKGRITKKAIHKGVGRYIDKHNSILCSDSHLSFQNYTKERDIDHRCIFVRRKEFVVDRIYHIQNINRIHKQLKEWIRRFNGVSTKYLQNYLNYYRIVFSTQNKTNQTKTAILSILTANNVYIQRDKISQQYCIT